MQYSAASDRLKVVRATPQGTVGGRENLEMQRAARVEEDIREPALGRELPSATGFVDQQHTATLRQEGGKKRKGGLEQAYEGFLTLLSTLPRPVLIAVLWLGGVALMSVCGVALYLVWLSLQALAGG